MTLLWVLYLKETTLLNDWLKSVYDGRREHLKNFPKCCSSILSLILKVDLAGLTKKYIINSVVILNICHRIGGCNPFTSRFKKSFSSDGNFKKDLKRFRGKAYTTNLKGSWGYQKLMLSVQVSNAEKSQVVLPLCLKTWPERQVFKLYPKHLTSQFRGVTRRNKVAFAM